MDRAALLQPLLSTPGLWALIAVFFVACLLKVRGRRRAAPSHRRTLKTIRRAQIAPRAVLNMSERKLHRQLAQIVGQGTGQGGGHTLLAQVSMGEFLKVEGQRAARSNWQTVFNAFNAKRVDFLIVDADWLPLLALEYQGSGHYQGNARARDAIKRAVCDRAAIPLMEVASAGLTPAQVREVRQRLTHRRATAAA